MRRSRKRSAMQDPVIKDADSRSDSRGQAVWRPASIHATRLLALALSEGHPDVLTQLGSHAAAVRAAVGATLDRAEVQQAGGDRSKRDLKATRGRVDALLLLKEKGLAEILGLLSGLLPPLVHPGALPSHAVLVDITCGIRRKPSFSLFAAELLESASFSSETNLTFYQ